MHILLAGTTPPAHIAQEQRRSGRTRIAPIRHRESPDLHADDEKPKQPRKRPSNQTKQQQMQMHAPPPATKRPQSTYDGSDAAMRKMKRQLRQQQEEIVKLQAALLDNQRIMMGLVPHGATASTAPAASAPFTTIVPAPRAVVAPVAPEARGDMSRETLLALGNRIEALGYSDLLRALKAVGLPSDATELDLDALDTVQQWRLYDFEAACRPSVLPRKSHKRTTSRSRRPSNFSDTLETARQATERKLEEVRALRTALAHEAETSEGADEHDDESQAEDPSVHDDVPDEGDGDDGADELLCQLGWADGLEDGLVDGWEELDV